jgi:hypothetical protein
MRSFAALSSLGAVLLVAACGGNVSLGNNQGAVGKGDADGGADGAAVDCSAPDACGPALGMPNRLCDDGKTTAGPTGRCLDKGGVCGWEIVECPSALTCFDNGGSLSPEVRACAKDEDCTSIDVQVDCCGNTTAMGAAKANGAFAQKCADDRKAGYPGCGCPQGPTKADDGTTGAGQGARVTVKCTGGFCKTTFDPCAGETLPACPRECTTFPETGACTNGDKCRAAGSQIGDECSCTGGTWGCAVHPPLGMGCNLVCR